MSRSVDYYFSIASPWSYLGHGRFMELTAKHGVPANVKPVDYGRIFPVSGGLPLKQRAPQRQAYRLVELARWRDFLGLPLTLEPKFFPFPADAAARAVIAADIEKGPAAAMRLAYALMRGCWVEDRNVGDADTVRAIVIEQDIDPAALGEVAVAADAQAKYELYTEEAIARGVFGAPSYVVGDEIFWGQDRLDFLDRRLAK
ncbi:MAG TPA: 2-hydroxychromene-2-carboxylate isomerase [Burkholderiales bacterium]|nr:2-hydroxychromene-2-carboxylate isomerase [Burkholderiales bacterium]